MLGAFTLRVIFLGATLFNSTEEQLFHLKQKAFMNTPEESFHYFSLKEL